MRALRVAMKHHSSLIGLVFFSLALGAVAYAQTSEISSVTITDMTDSAATIKWTTSALSDGTINFGLDSRVGVIRDPAFDKKDHALTIDELDSATTYYFRVISADEGGNRSTTGNL